LKQLRKILIADDNKMISQALRLLFESRGYEVTVANDGKEALERFERDKQDLGFVIVDYNMPHLNGAEVARKIRSSLPDIPIVLASSSAQELRGKPKIRSLFDAIFDKPFMIKELLSCLESFEGRGSALELEVA
jgi:CheY-like chemotaxis protein